jgi:hypothetical protein
MEILDDIGGLYNYNGDIYGIYLANNMILVWLKL